jgi:nucleoside-diphosphate-sugar epimerase
MVEILNGYKSSEMQAEAQNLVVAITGARGFIGRHLIEGVLERGDVLIRALVRNPAPLIRQHHNLTVIHGDLTKLETLSCFLVPGCTVVNLAYSSELTPAENLLSIENLIKVCKKSHVKRVIHCSTASVYGRTHENTVNEESLCNPKTEYGITKRLIEQMLEDGARGNFEFVNLRPTSVFGYEGPALTKLISDLTNRNRLLLNYLKSCLFNKRKLNLVDVGTVVAAILFIFDKAHGVDGQSYIISEDHEFINNFEYIEKLFLSELYGRYYFLPPIRLPLTLLSLILNLCGKDADNPLLIYDSSKIRKLGFNPPRPLKSNLVNFVRLKKEQRENS